MDLSFVPIGRSGLDDFTPAQFEGLYWPSLADVFGFRSSGVQTKRDAFVYAFARDVLVDRVDQLSRLPTGEAAEAFQPTVARTVEAAIALPLEPKDIARASYRPLDVRMALTPTRFIDRPRPALRAAWGAENVALYAMPANTGAGPAVWMHGLLPDYHAFSGRGGYAFPLWDRRRGAAAHNLNPQLLTGLAAEYGAPVPPENAFHAIAALLSATTYTQRFAFDLEEVFPHIPFPSDPAAFAEAVRIGAELRAVATFARAPAPRFQTARLEGRASGVILAVPRLRDAFLQDGRGSGAIPLQGDGSLRVTRVPDAVWAFEVSGYRVLYRWLAAREGEAIDASLQRTILDVAWRIEELLHWSREADAILDHAVARPLTRTGLGL